jgi:hypothetical protein
MLYGVKGTGKNLLLSHLLAWTLQPTACPAPIKTNPNATPFHLIRIDCTQKDIDQIFFQILMELGSHIQMQFSLEKLQTYTSAMLWNAFKLLVQKIPDPIILFFQAAEYVDASYLSKFYNFAKEMQRIQILTTLNMRIPPNAFRAYEGMDHRMLMDQYTMPELETIIHQRAMMAFPTPLTRSSLELLVDVVADFENQTPGACINLLKVCYPQILDTHDLTPEMLRLAGQFHFEGQVMDMVSMIDFVSKTTFEDRCFLEYLVNFFRDGSKYYISFADIKKMYKMTCEELGMAPTKEEFFTSLKKITQSQILRPSLFHSTPEMQKIHGIYPVPYYLTVPIDEINEVMDVAFGMIGNET